MAALRDGVGDVLDGLPFASLASNQEVDVGHFKSAGLASKSSGARTESDVLHFHIPVGDNAHRDKAELLFQLLGEFADIRLRNRKEIWILRILVFFPAEFADHTGQNSVRLSHVPIIVKSPDHKVVIRDEFLLGRKDWIVVTLLQLL